MPKYHGKRGVVYISTTMAGTASPVQLTEWTLNMATDKTEVTSFGDANKTYVQGLKDLSGTISGFWDSANDALFDAADSADGVRMYLYPSADAPTIFWEGPAFLDASISVGVGGAVAMSGSFVAAGSWTRRP